MKRTQYLCPHCGLGGELSPSDDPDSIWDAGSWFYEEEFPQHLEFSHGHTIRDIKLIRKDLSMLGLLTTREVEIEDPRKTTSNLL